MTFNWCVCLFVVYRPTGEFFTPGDVIIAGKGMQNLTFARHSWPLSSEHSLACHTRHPFIMIISEDPWHYNLLPRVGMELPLPVFTTLVCRGWDSNTKTSVCEANTPTHCTTAAVNNVLKPLTSYTLVTITSNLNRHYVQPFLGVLFSYIFFS